MYLFISKMMASSIKNAFAQCVANVIYGLLSAFGIPKSLLQQKIMVEYYVLYICLMTNKEVTCLIKYKGRETNIILNLHRKDGSNKSFSALRILKILERYPSQKTNVVVLYVFTNT